MRLTSRLHGIVDYIVVAFLWLSPTIFFLPEMTSVFTYILGGVHLTLTLFTDFELGIFKIISLRIHGWIELLVAIGLLGVAFWLGNLEGSTSKYFYIGFAIAVFLTWLITDYNSNRNSSIKVTK